MASTPNYAATPLVGVAAISTANTNRDGTGTLATVVTAGSSGSRIDGVVVQASGITTAGMVRLYLHDGSTARLWHEVPVTAITPSASVAAFRSEMILDQPVILANGWSLRASTHNAEAFNVAAFGGSF